MVQSGESRARDAAFRREEASRAVADAAPLRDLEPRYVADARLRWGAAGFHALPALHSRRGVFELSSPHAACVLEAMALTQDTRAALQLYWRFAAASEATLAGLPGGCWAEECLSLKTGRVLRETLDGIHDLTDEVESGNSITLGVQQRERQWTKKASVEAFVAAVKELALAGLVNPPTARVSLGHFVRREPFCQRYGRGRGTVVDRYYLDQFLRKARLAVRGRTIEVGTSLLTDDHRIECGFPNVNDYRTLDIIPGPNVDICGDIADRSVLPAESIDSILCLNVLEHCANVEGVVDNMFEWLAPGGHVFCMVPSVQRVHEAPKDYWRPLPGGLEHLFRRFPRRTLDVYGNLLATIAALAGLAVEDLPPGALDEHHPDYPVASCIVAGK